MEKMVFEIFWKEIERQCKFANTAINELRNGLSEHNPNRIWSAIHSLLTAAGTLSKILWPKKIRSMKRGKILRESLDIKYKSPLKKRKFKQYFEHYDDQIENWASSSERHHFVDSNIGPPNMASGMEPEDILHNFDDTTWTLKFGEETFELRPLIDIINDLYKKVSVKLK